jgi:DNA repair protein RAD57
MPAFTNVGQNIFLFKPDVTKSATKGDKREGSPALVILCTWLGGSTTRRVHIYTAGYHQLFPNAHILLIRTTLADITMRSFRQIRERLAPARDAINRIAGQTKSSGHEIDGSILLHIFSHGGCNTAIQLAVSMREAGLGLPLGRIVFDCCPGDATFRKAYNAAVLSLPSSQPARSIGSLALYPSIAAITGLQSLRIMSSVRELRAQLNHPAVFGSHARRLYLYSAADQMVDFRDVQLHLEAARGRGYQAEGVLFWRSAHCALILEDAARYWTAIEKFWQEGDQLRAIGSIDSVAATEDDAKASISLSQSKL